MPGKLNHGATTSSVTSGCPLSFLGLHFVTCKVESGIGWFLGSLIINDSLEKEAMDPNQIYGLFSPSLCVLSPFARLGWRWGEGAAAFCGVTRHYLP